MAPLHVEAVGSGPPLVLLHGWGMHSGLWSPVLPALAARFRVYAVDLPGHGHSDAPPTFDLGSLAATVAEHWFGGDAYAAPPVTVLGWSLGALVALEWARRAPDALARIVLTGPTPRFVAAPDWPHALDEATLVRFGDELRVAYDHTLKRFLALQLQGTDAGRAALAAVRHQLFARGRPLPEVLRAGLALLRDSDVRADLASVLQPALVIAGDRDTLAPLEASRWLAAHLPHGRLEVIAGAAHIPFLSHPQAFVRALLAFTDEA